HLFYGDDVGNPGTEITFFDWPNVGRNMPGAGEVSAVGFVVPENGALEWWRGRLEAEGVHHTGIERRGNRSVLPFEDREGQRLELIAGSGQEGVGAWRESPVPADMAIRGLAAVTLVVESLEPSAQFLEHALGFTRAGEYRFLDNESRQASIFQVGPGGLGTEVHLEVRPDLPAARQGIGGVHHVAFRAADDERHREWHDRLQRFGVAVTPVIDRYYFRSIYFREPGGVLYEIATDGPGFTGDEDVEHLGERLSLPPFLEPRRNEIESQLEPLPT
ncbi:MAG TPA: ring-cleaving dioxygenase, partial [Chloroflexota bacterium]|nr:ring-cleaving dioxygenase [Chloroflexota bacterium]